MRLDIEIFIDIFNEFGSFTIEYNSDQSFFLRFGYWDRIDTIKFSNIIPEYLIVEEICFEDSDCLDKFAYILKHKSYG